MKTKVPPPAHGIRPAPISVVLQAIKTYLRFLMNKQRDRGDLFIINRLAERLNEEAEDVLGYQTEL